MAEAFEGNKLSAMGDGDRGAGKGVLGNRFFKDGERGGKDVILALARTDQKRRRTWSGAIQSGETS